MNQIVILQKIIKSNHKLNNFTHSKKYQKQNKKIN